MAFSDTQPRDAAGQFAQKTGSAAEVSLSPTDPVLEAALLRYGLTVADVPRDHEGQSIEDRWAERFDVLNDARLATVEEHLNEELGHPDYGRLQSGPWLAWRDDDAYLEDWKTVRPGDDWAGREAVAMVHTRNGAGNRDCYCDETEDGSHEYGCVARANELMQEHPAFLADQDNTWDRTYANFAFTVDRKEAKKAVALAAPSQDQRSARNLREAIESGRVAPWIVFPPNPVTVARIDELAASQKNIETGDMHKLPSGANCTGFGFIGQEHVDDLNDKLRVLTEGGTPVPPARKRLWSYDRYSKPQDEYETLQKTERAAAAATAAREAIADPATSEPLKLALNTALGSAFGLAYEEKKLDSRRAAHAKLVAMLIADRDAAEAALKRKNFRTYLTEEIGALRRESTWPGEGRAPLPVQ